jgi:hypothetical protein
VVGAGKDEWEDREEGEWVEEMDHSCYQRREPGLVGARLYDLSWKASGGWLRVQLATDASYRTGRAQLPIPELIAKETHIARERQPGDGRTPTSSGLRSKKAVFSDCFHCIIILLPPNRLQITPDNPHLSPLCPIHRDACVGTKCQKIEFVFKHLLRCICVGCLSIVSV